jgi:UDP-N-acetyl-D-mannosaminuronic acid transferase (WecB/TagA/CpsF family)
MNSAPNVSPDTESLVGLVMELGSQLHIERARRVALEEALLAAGVLTREAIGVAGSDPAVRERTQKLLEDSIGKLVAVLTEDPDPRVPLRKQSLAGPFKPS